MNYLYRETTISNPVETVLILGDYILVHNHSTLKLYNFSMNLIKQQYFFEKILAVCRTGEETFAILFDGNKMTHCDLSFNPISLRIVKGYGLDHYNGFCIIKDRIAPQIFNLKDPTIRDIPLFNLGIHSAIDMFLIFSYAPTLLVLSENSKCSVVSLDAEPSKVDEFEVIDNVLAFKAAEKFVVFLNRNFIQIRYKRDNVIIQLNQTLKPSVLGPNLSSCVMEPKRDEFDESKSIYLESPCVFTREDAIFVCNNNGEMFEIAMKIDSKKILGSKISFLGRTTVPSSVDCTPEYLCIGSTVNDTILFSFSEDQDQVPRGLQEISRLSNVGLVCGSSITPNKELVLMTTKGIYKAWKCIDIQLFNKARCNLKITRISVINNRIVVFTQDAVFVMDENLKLVEAIDDESLHFWYIEKFKFQHDIDSATLSVYTGNCETNQLLRSFAGVKVWSFQGNYLVIVKNCSLKIININTFETIFESGRILEFQNEIYNERIYFGASLEEIAFKSIGKVPDSDSLVEEIVEVLIYKGTVPFVLFRTLKQLYVYKYTQEKLCKVFITKPLIFGNCQSALFCLPNGVYCRSRSPCIIVFTDEVFFYDASHKIGFPVFYNGWIFARSKGYLLKCKIMKNDPELCYSHGIILKRLHKFDNTLVKTGITHERDVIEDSRMASERRGIVSLQDCNVLAVAKYAPYRYVPFVPMVYTSDGPGNAIKSEPILKESEMYVENPNNPPLLGRTLRYSIELMSSDFKLMSSIEMDENEFICDMKILFNNFLFVCSSYPEGENKATKGRLSVFSLANIVPDPAKPHIYKKLKPICSESFKAACMNCEEVRSRVAVCVGTRLMIYEFDENVGLTAFGRNEVGLFCTSLFVTKNLITVSDIYNGLYFFFMRPKDPLSITLLGRSCLKEECRFVLGINFTDQESKKTQLSLISVGMAGSIRIYTYSPYQLESKNGNQLIKRAQILTKLTNPLYYTKPVCLTEKECCIISSNILVRISVINLSKTHTVQNCIASFIRDIAGINARNYLESEDYLNSDCKSVISERILLMFFYFSPEVQTEICELLNMTYFTLAEMIEDGLRMH